jgi:hypothetical protein
VDRTALNTEIGKASGGTTGPGKGQFQQKIEDAVGVYIAIALFFVVSVHSSCGYAYAASFGHSHIARRESSRSCCSIWIECAQVLLIVDLTNTRLKNTHRIIA